MGLRSIIANAVTSAFIALGDIPESVTIKNISGVPTRDPLTGSYSTTVTDTVCQAVFVALSEDENAVNLQDAELKAIIKTSAVPTVNPGDYVIRDAVSYQILTINDDPANATHTLFLRKRKVTVNPGASQPPVNGSGPAFGGYIHLQSVPSTLWTINHNLGFRPSVELTDDAGNEVAADVQHVNDFQVRVYLLIATSGRARLI